MSDEYLVAADMLEEAGFDEQASSMRSPLRNLIGERVAVYGPNYIWRGTLRGFDDTDIWLDDVGQVFETGDHGTDDCESELICEKDFIVPRSALCNISPARWA